MWLVSYVTCVDIIAQVLLTRWSIFLFLYSQTLKRGIVNIILPTDWPEIILPTAHTTKKLSCLYLILLLSASLLNIHKTLPPIDLL